MVNHQLFPSIGCTLVAILAAGTAMAQNATELTPAQQAAGWTVLFDGESTDQFRGYRLETFPESGWRVENGTLRAIEGGTAADIITREQFEDFELAFEWKAGPGANSGVMYRVAELHDTTWQTGPEYQILDDAGAGVEPTAPNAAGACYGLYAPAEAKVSRPAGEWNTGRIRLKDGRLKHWLNGVKIVEADLNSPEWTKRVQASKFNEYEGFGEQTRGHIAFQGYGRDVWYRNIRVRELDAPLPDEIKLFNGVDFDGWTAFFPDGTPLEAAWSVEDGIIICKGQPIGYIRTTEDYANYVLTLEWRFNPVTKQAGNSGVLLRMIEEDKVWPRSVEAQLHGGNAGDFWNIGDFPMQTVADRTRGRNTRKSHNAEHPIGEWNEYEIIVNGDEIILNVNGEQLNRAWDVMEVSGKICLQSEGAEIHFRDIRLAPITAFDESKLFGSWISERMEGVGCGDFMESIGITLREDHTYLVVAEMLVNDEAITDDRTGTWRIPEPGIIEFTSDDEALDEDGDGVGATFRSTFRMEDGQFVMVDGQTECTVYFNRQDEDDD